MKRCQLSDLVIPVDTWNPARSDPEESFQYIDLSAIDQEGKSIVGAREVGCAEAPSRARQLVEAGDILVSTVRPNLNGVARVPDELDGATASTGFCVVRPKPEALDGSYLFHWVKSAEFINEMVRKATGASYPAVSDRIVLASTIPLPSLAEQRRIAAILDQADGLRTKRREALALLDELQRGIFIEMFGDPATNPKGWKTKPLGTVVKTTSGGTPDRSAHGYYGGTIPWVKSGELHQRLVTTTEEHITELGLANSAAKLMPPGTVLLAMYGATVGAVSELAVHAATNQAVCCMQPSREVCSSFLIAFMKQYTPTLLARRVGGAQPNLSQDLIRNIPISLPSIELQEEFNRRLKSALYLESQHQKASDMLSSLFAALQHRAFRGEL